MSAFKSDRIGNEILSFKRILFHQHLDVMKTRQIDVWFEVTSSIWFGEFFFISLMGRKVWNYGKTHYHVRLLDQTCSPHWTSTAWLSGFWRVCLPWARFGYNLVQIYQFEDLVKINRKISTVVLHWSAVFKYKICQNYVKNCCRPQIHYFDITKVQLRQLVD